MTHNKSLCDLRPAAVFSRERCWCETACVAGEVLCLQDNQGLCIMLLKNLTSIQVQMCPQLFSVKSRQMPRTSSGINSTRLVNSLEKKVWLSFGCEDMALRSSRGAHAMPTEKMVIPVIGGQETGEVMCQVNSSLILTMF